MRRLPLMLALAPLLALSGRAQVDLYTFEGEAGDWSGGAVDGTGDVNGDGVPDLVVGAVQHDGNGLNSGIVRVYSGLDGALLHAFHGDDSNDHLGGSVAGAGDVNADGFADVIAGASIEDGPGLLDRGMARVFSGRDGSELFTFYGDESGANFGYAVDGAGDVNDDGFDDVIVGATFHDGGGTSSGGVWVHSGLDGSLLHERFGAAGDRLGHAVAGVGDMNGDGHDDFAAGAWLADGSGVERGAVLVWSGLDGSLLHAFEGTSDGDHFGLTLAAAGDVNMDGRPDLIVGSRSDGAVSQGNARADVFSGLDGAHLHAFSGPEFFFQSGWATVGGAGDVDADGHADLVVGLDREFGFAGSARVLSGLDGRLLYTVYGDDISDHLGVAVAGAGDVDGDGAGDVIVGSYWDDGNGHNAGKAVVVSSGGALGEVICSPNSPHSLGYSGVISAQGTTAVASDDVVLVAHQLPPNEFGYFVVGSEQGFTPGTGNQGLLCVGGTLGRFSAPGQVQSSGAWGSFRLGLMGTRIPQGSSLVALQPGDSWTFQAWFRDGNSGAGSHFTSALTITLQ